jgi:hypothetical protein
MKVGDSVIWNDENGISRICTILNNNEETSTYDILLPERNVMFKSIYTQFDKQLNNDKQINGNNDEKITIGEIVIYKKGKELREAVVVDIDWASNSVQIQIINRDIK